MRFVPSYFFIVAHTGFQLSSLPTRAFNVHLHMPTKKGALATYYSRCRTSAGIKKRPLRMSMTNGNGGIKMDTAQPLGPSNNTRIVHNLAVYACSAGLAFYLALSVDDIRLSDLADPNVAQVAFTNIVTAASPGDNIDDAAAITVSEAAAEVIAQALRTTAPCFFRFASIAALDMAQFVAFAARKAFRISGFVAAEAEAVDAGPAGGESYLRRLSSLERPLIRQVVSPQRLGAALRRRVTAVDLQTELMLWLLFAVLSDGYMTQDHQDW